MSLPAPDLPTASSVPSSQLTETERDALLCDQRASVIRDAFRALRERQRVVLALHYFEELSLAQIAPVLGVTESRARRIHRQALRTLRDALHAPLGLAA
jgi:RNA polymerase sigma factor for flagellar operon FliA